MHPNIEYFIFSVLYVETQKLRQIVTKTFYYVLKSGEIKSRSPFGTEPDHFYCLEAPGSLWPAAVGFPGLTGSTNDQFLH